MDLHEFKVKLVYKSSSRIARLSKETCLKKMKQMNKQKQFGFQSINNLQPSLPDFQIPTMQTSIASYDHFNTQKCLCLSSGLSPSYSLSQASRVLMCVPTWL